MTRPSSVWWTGAEPVQLGLQRRQPVGLVAADMADAAKVVG